MSHVPEVAVAVATGGDVDRWVLDLSWCSTDLDNAGFGTGGVRPCLGRCHVGQLSNPRVVLTDLGGEHVKTVGFVVGHGAVGAGIGLYGCEQSI